MAVSIEAATAQIAFLREFVEASRQMFDGLGVMQANARLVQPWKALTLGVGRFPNRGQCHFAPVFHAVTPSPDFSVRPNGAVHQWRKNPPRKLSVGPGS
jgi:hypothetical protein